MIWPIASSSAIFNTKSFYEVHEFHLTSFSSFRHVIFALRLVLDMRALRECYAQYHLIIDWLGLQLIFNMRFGVLGFETKKTFYSHW